MGLKEDLLRGIYSYGFEKPSAIQQRAIKPLIMMRDTIAQAQSGTGKTATFTIGLLQNIDIANRDCQALILAPTRELATQIVKVVMAIGDYLGITTMVRPVREAARCRRRLASRASVRAPLGVHRRHQRARGHEQAAEGRAAGGRCARGWVGRGRRRLGCPQWSAPLGREGGGSDRRGGAIEPTRPPLQARRAVCST